MTPLELSYPIIGLILALGGSVYGWQSRRQLAQATAELEAQKAALSQSQSPVVKVETTPVAASSEELVHIQGKLRHLEQDLQNSKATLQATIAARDELSQNYQAQEKVLATLRQQLTQQQTTEADRLKTLQQQNQEILRENSNLSERLRQAVNSLADARPKLLQLQGLETKNQQLTEQLEQATQQQTETVAAQLAEREAQWQQQQETSTAQIRQLETRLQQLTTERDGAQGQLTAFQQQADAAQAQIQSLEASLQQLSTAQQEWHSEREKLNAKVNALEENQKALTLKHQELTVKLETTQTQGDRLKVEKKDQAAALQVAQGEIAKLEQQLAALTEAQSQTPAASTPVTAPEPTVATTAEPEPAAIEPEIETVSVQTTPEPVPSQPVTEILAAEESEESEESEKTAEAVSEPVSEIVAETTSATVTESVSEVIPQTVPETQEAEPAEAETNAQTSILTDKKVVILGTLNAMNREEAKTRLQQIGAHYTSAPSSKTDFVVVGKAPGDKLKKAQKLGIPQLSEAQFMELIGK